jgi:hypothetical protein
MVKTLLSHGQEDQVQPLEPSMMQGPLLGRWTYRSFMNNPGIDVDFGELEFGRGEMIVDYVCPGIFVGRLVFAEDYQFRLRGVATSGDPPTIRFRGIGDADASKDQIYDYFGCLMPLWPHPVRKRLTIVGSLVRAVAHDGDSAPAGQAATFIAIKRDVFWEPGTTQQPAPQQPEQPAPQQPEQPAPQQPEESGDADETGGTDESEGSSEGRSRRRGR